MSPYRLVSPENTAATGGFVRLVRIRPTLPQTTRSFAPATGYARNSGYSLWVATTSWLLKRAAIALASAVMLAVACANDPQSLGQPAGAETIATNLDVPWGIAFLPDGSALIAERDSGAIQHMPQPGVVNNVGGVPGVAARGEGGLLGLATAGQTVFAYITTAGRQPCRDDALRRGVADRAVGDPHRHSCGFRSRRRADRVRPGRQALCDDGRERRSWSCAGPVVAGRQDTSDQPRRFHPVGQSRSRLAGLVLRSSQYPRAGVGFGRTAVGHGVRREPVGRAELDPAGRQLRVADGRRPRRHGGADRPGGPVGYWRSVAVGTGVYRRLAVGGVSSRSAALPSTGRLRRLSGRSGTAVRRTVRTAAHRCRRAGWRAMVHDQQPRRSGKPAGRRRPGPAVPALSQRQSTLCSARPAPTAGLMRTPTLPSARVCRSDCGSVAGSPVAGAAARCRRASTVELSTCADGSASEAGARAGIIDQIHQLAIGEIQCAF